MVQLLESGLMLRTLVLALCAIWPLSSHADPFAGADPDKGKALADKSCVACHDAQFGDPTRIYTRPERRVKSPDQLLKQVTTCSKAAGTNWSKAEIANVAAYLNRAFYKFQ
jgi:mono/diheme cytochrome c family protein